MPQYLIYKLVSNNTELVYYGHTKQRLSKRKNKHKSDAKDQTKKKPCTSKLIIDTGDYEIIEVEKINCLDKNEAKARERWWIENNECVNKNIPGRTAIEYGKTDERKMSHKKSKLKRKSIDSKREKQIIYCDICGQKGTHGHKSRHYKNCIEKYCGIFKIF